jgi:ATP-dependent RNA helicase DDX18/HAS1
MCLSLWLQVMVCTDRTSRGVDFDTADVEHVALFDFPRDPSEYVRRVGRTGRAGRVGRVTAFVIGKQVRGAVAWADA